MSKSRLPLIGFLILTALLGTGCATEGSGDSTPTPFTAKASPAATKAAAAVAESPTPAPGTKYAAVSFEELVTIWEEISGEDCSTVESSIQYVSRTALCNQGAVFAFSSDDGMEQHRRAVLDGDAGVHIEQVLSSDWGIAGTQGHSKEVIERVGGEVFIVRAQEDENTPDMDDPVTVRDLDELIDMWETESGRSCLKANVAKVMYASESVRCGTRTQLAIYPSTVERNLQVAATDALGIESTWVVGQNWTVNSSAIDREDFAAKYGAEVVTLGG